MSSIVKMATLLVAVACEADARYSRRQEKHPLLETPAHVNSIVREDGGISMRMHRENSHREMSHAEHQAMRK